MWAETFTPTMHMDSMILAEPCTPHLLVDRHHLVTKRVKHIAEWQGLERCKQASDGVAKPQRVCSSSSSSCCTYSSGSSRQRSRHATCPVGILLCVPASLKNRTRN